MKIIHFSDPHAGGPAEDWMAYFDKRWVGVFNYRFRRRFKHDLSKLASAVDYICDVRPDVAVCTGDLTSTGQPGEFAKVFEVLKNSHLGVFPCHPKYIQKIFLTSEIALRGKKKHIEVFFLGQK